MEQDPTRICELLVGLGDVDVVGVVDEATEPLVVHIQTRSRPVCSGCGGLVWSKGTSAVRLVDLPAFGRAVRLVWYKWRWRCPAAGCGVASFTETNDEIAPVRSALTCRAGRWATTAVGRDARAVSDVAAELGCDWHTVNKAVLCWGEALLAADCDRVGSVEALGLDETLFGREGRWRTRRWCTSIVDVTGGQLLDIVAGRDAQAPIRWLLAQPHRWRDGIAWGTLDLSGAYRRSFDVALPQAGQVADPFHVIRLANNSLDETRRRTQNDTLGHRGRKHDPLYRARRLLISAHERLSEHADTKLRGLLTAGGVGIIRSSTGIRLGSPTGPPKQSLSGACQRVSSMSLTGMWWVVVDALSGSCRRCPRCCWRRELDRASFGLALPVGMLRRWPMRVQPSPGPGSTAFRRFANYRIRALLYAGKPMRVRIEVGSTGGGGSQTRAPPCGGGFPVECLPAGAGPVMSLDRSV